MPPSSNTSWTPSAGRHQLNIGSSLGRALRARKNNAPGPAKRNVLPEREFYSVRYGHKPPRIDSTKPGSLEVNRTTDDSSASVTVEHASTQPGELYVFPGKEVISKEWICILIYDEETGGYTLEKLESSIALGAPEKRAGSTRPSQSPSAQSNSPPASAPSSSTHQATNLDDNLEDPPASIPMEVDGAEEDEILNVQVETPAPPALPAPPAGQRPKKSLPHRSLPRPEQATAQSQSHSTPTSSIPPPPKPTQTPVTTSKTKTKEPKNKKPTTTKRATPTFSDGEDETLEFGRVTKRNRVSPVLPVLPAAPEPTRRGLSPSRLELPGMANAVVQPPPVPVSTKPVPAKSESSSTSSNARSQRPPPSPVMVVSDSDSDDDSANGGWVQVPVAAATSGSAVEPTAPAPEDEGEGEEIDLNEFNTLLNEELFEEQDQDQYQGQYQYQDQYRDSTAPLDDFLAAAIAPEESPVLPVARGQPISLRQFAGGDSADEEDFSSSEESDED
ncbi:hypothetical protein EV360DRAFT_82075 [Lentinula raphanica]|nr:hypothetical protein EV360DRAFT_82075 [Lentinula raphanica]